MLKRPLPALWPAALLAALIAFGLGAHFLDLFEWRDALDWARGYAQRWWLPLALILLQMVLFMFALPGSTMLWIVAPLYAPAASTLVLAAGGSAGGLAAYWFARRLSDESLAHLRASRGYRCWSAKAISSSCARCAWYRPFPIPCSTTAPASYACPWGVSWPPPRFGFGVKAYLYSSVIHHALEAADPADLLRAEAVLPLIRLALALFAARMLQRRWGRPPPDRPRSD